MNDLKRLQRKMIPVNLLISIIALVAAISLIFAPLISIDAGEILTGLSEELSSSSESEGEHNDEAAGTEGVDEYLSAMLDSFGEIKISLTTYDVAKFAFAEDSTQLLVNSFVDEIKAFETELINNVAVILIPQLIEENVDGIATDLLDPQAVVDKFNDIFSAKTDEEVDVAIRGLAEEIQRQAVTDNGEYLIPDESIEEVVDIIRQYYDEAVAKLDGEDLTLESFICVTLSDMMSDADEDSEATIYTNYNDLISALLGLSEDSLLGGDSQALEGIREILEIVVNVAKYFAIVMFVFAGIWALQFLFAFLHMFGKNKRFAMWYTKLLGFIPCLIFYIAPLVAAAVLKSVEGAEIALVVLGAISSMTWISGICYLLLWLVSIFWAFPIKRKIRKAINAGATY